MLNEHLSQLHYIDKLSLLHIDALCLCSAKFVTTFLQLYAAAVHKHSALQAYVQSCTSRDTAGSMM